MLEKLALTAITPNPDQPRKIFDADGLKELAASIKANGLLQPITVRPKGKGKYEIVAGERRFRACSLLHAHGVKGFATIACHVRKMDDLTRDVAAIIENLQRADVTPLEEADSFARLENTGLSAEQIADKIGVAAFRVRWRLQLLNLSPDIRKLFATGNLDRQQAMEIARLSDYAAQHRILTMIRRGNLVGWKSVRNAVDAILDPASQAGMFGDDAPAATAADLSTLRAMEKRIESVGAMLSMGWKDGQCIVANRVDPDRAANMADKISAMTKGLRIMERELRNTCAQAFMSIDAA
jgi:ParB family chromosome partitioning protein